MLVYMTFPDSTLARDVAEALVENKLAAGAHLSGPIKSVYRWDGAIRYAEEWSVLAQAPEAAFTALRDFVIKRHPYITPCLVGWRIGDGHAPFLEWIERSGE